jgi:23S rRNA (cytidine1920-2'-O)/16S rRNA (cytidine1409-2'-O)-methyltransferase
MSLFHACVQPQVQSTLKMAKKRIDLALVEAGLAESRSQAQKLIMAGQVRVNGELVHQASQRVEQGASIAVDQGPAFVSRGGDKLKAALAAFGISVGGAVCADIGASTGGFTDCLLQHGASRVYAIDVGRGQLHWKLRQDTRVIPIEGQNVRYLESLPEMVDLVVVDVSFISVGLVLPVAAGLVRPGGDIVVLVKPQFEAGRQHIRRGGVVKDEAVRRETVARVIDSARGEDLWAHGLIRSPLKGPKGNEEFLLWLREASARVDHQQLLDSVFDSSEPAGQGSPP